MAAPKLQEGDARFARGMDSVSDPKTIPSEAYSLSVNMLNRGGCLQTRPGYRRCVSLPAGKLQGLSVYTPVVGTPSLVAFVAGVAYASEYPFRDYRLVEGANLSANSDLVYTAETTKAVSRNSDGSLRLEQPQTLLMAQDGVNPCIYYDGQKTQRATGVPQGTHMAWSGARLWVARRKQLFAGDIADPLSFVETTYNALGGARYFILPGLITGLSPLPSSSSVKTPLLAFTDSSTEMFRSNILARDSWPTVEDFQSTLFTNTGCVSSRSIISQGGMLRWLSDFGFTDLDSAANSNVSSKIDFIDREMVRSGKRLSDNLAGVASAAYENFLLHSMPHASKRNRHTWVFDGSTNELLGETFPSAWASIWTGINPVQWTSLKINGRTHLFCASVDDDGQNRIYEAFTSERRDNGCDIPWVFETRSYSGGSLAMKEFRWAEFALSEIAGQVDMKVQWAGGNRGRWKTISTPRFFAKEGNVEAGRTFEYSDPLYALKKQSRAQRTQDARDLPQDELTSSGIEGQIFRVEDEKENVDSSFALRFEGSGQVAFRSVRLFMDPIAEPDGGAVDNVETDNHFVRFDGAAAREEEPLQEAPEVFTASATATAQVKKSAASASASVTSTVSQSDADKRAQQIAQARAEAQLRRIAPYYNPA
jgi:hypothetical protein